MSGGRQELSAAAASAAPHSYGAEARGERQLPPAHSQEQYHHHHQYGGAPPGGAPPECYAPAAPPQGHGTAPAHTGGGAPPSPPQHRVLSLFPSSS